VIKDFANKRVWIIGASSGIGKAVAIELAKQGASLVLSARRQQRLDELNQQLNSQHQVIGLDVTATAEVKSATEQIGHIDSVLFFAAGYEPNSIESMDIEQAKNLVDINLNGALNVVHAVLPLMQQQGSGQIALCASVAGYMGLPNGQPYSATKAALINFAESLRIEQPKLDIKVINPGFVSTELTDKNNFKMPMITTPEKAALSIVKGLKSKQFEIHFPKRFTVLLKLIKSLPYWLYFRIIKK
jgi:short-subunit dehydrogenase